MIRSIKQLGRRTFLGWLQLKHDKARFLTAISGIAFADMLIFMQIGFLNALYETNTQYPRYIDADIVLLSTQARELKQLQTFPRRRLYQAMDIPGIDSANALYVNSINWKNPQTGEKTGMMVLGQDPERSAFKLPEVNQHLDTIKLPDRVLFDKASRGDYEEVIAKVERGMGVTTEIDRRTITISGLFRVGASFATDGALITSDQNFLRLFPKRNAGSISMGLIHLENGYEPLEIKKFLNAYLPNDVQALTYQEYVDFEVDNIKNNSFIGFVFGLGSAVGFGVGVVIVYQVLSTDVNDHLAEYATLKAMGYRHLYLLGVVFEEAIILTILGFIPGLALSLGIYRLTRGATALAMNMTLTRVVLVFVLTIFMCGLSGAIASRKLQSADPADIF